MNWAKITSHAAALLIVQVAIGFIEASFTPKQANGHTYLLLGSALASFVMCGAIFAHLAARQPSRPFSHAWLTLILQAVVASLIVQALADWSGNTPLLLVALEWLVLMCALLAGTAIGSQLRRRAGQPADA